MLIHLVHMQFTNAKDTQHRHGKEDIQIKDTGQDNLKHTNN